MHSQSGDWERGKKRIRSLEIPCRKLKEEVGENTESFERQESAANVSCHPCEKDGKLLKNQKVIVTPRKAAQCIIQEDIGAENGRDTGNQTLRSQEKS